MSYKGKGVTVEGDTVTIKTESEATARGIAAAAERERLKNEGTRGERSAACAGARRDPSRHRERRRTRRWRRCY